MATNFFKTDLCWKFALTSKKHYPDLSSNALSVWIFCASFLVAYNTFSKGSFLLFVTFDVIWGDR